MKVTAYGDPLLRRQSEKIENIDEEILKLIKDMSGTIQPAGGVGLAAPQVGVSKMLFIIDWSKIDEDEQDGIKAYINPEIIEKKGKNIVLQEGCLSLPEVWADVERPDTIKVAYDNIDGERVEEKLTDFPARVFQHEYDHLLGILFIDRLTAQERAGLKETLKAIMDGRIKPFDGKNPVSADSELQNAAV